MEPEVVFSLFGALLYFMFIRGMFQRAISLKKYRTNICQEVFRNYSLEKSNKNSTIYTLYADFTHHWSHFVLPIFKVIGTIAVVAITVIILNSVDTNYSLFIILVAGVIFSYLATLDNPWARDLFALLFKEKERLDDIVYKASPEYAKKLADERFQQEEKIRKQKEYEELQEFARLNPNKVYRKTNSFANRMGFEGTLHKYADDSERTAAMRAGDASNQHLHHLRKSATHCFYCKRKFSSRLKAEVDHFYPIKLGGKNDKDNLVLACRRCNASKGAKDPYEWAKHKGFTIERE